MRSAESADPTAPEPVFRLEGVGKRFGVARVLTDVSLTVGHGERIALVGPNGAGKTTLFSLLVGSGVPTEGRLRIFGQDVDRLSPRRLRTVQRRIGTVSQRLDLVDELSVVHNVNAGNLGRWSFIRACYSLVRPREVERVAQCLARVGVEEKLFERTSRLSGGQKQRVAFARVLAQDPDVILADEPIANLDPSASRKIMDLLSSLNAEEGKTTIVALHDVGYAYSHSARLVGIRGGRVVLDGPTDQVPRSEVDALYRAGP